MNEICLSCRKHTKCGRAKVETIGCGYYVPQTNEEWIKSCNTEQLAERIISLCVTYFDRTDLSITGSVKESLKINDHYDGHIQKDLLVEWLKQPHTVKE